MYLKEFLLNGKHLFKIRTLMYINVYYLYTRIDPKQFKVIKSKSKAGHMRTAGLFAHRLFLLRANPTGKLFERKTCSNPTRQDMWRITATCCAQPCIATNASPASQKLIGSFLSNIDQLRANPSWLESLGRPCQMIIWTAESQQWGRLPLQNSVGC